MSLSVIIPTLGRDSLHAAVASAADADEIIVVADHAQGPVATRDLPAPVVWANVMGGDHGYTAREHGITLATSTHLAFLDDDDVYTPDAIQLMRSAACGVPVIFRMDHPRHGILWRNKVLEFGNVGTPMMVVPNVPDRLGRWEPFAPDLQEPGGDYRFLAGCVDRMGGPVWREDVVARIRPADRGGARPTVTVVTPWLNHPELAAGYHEAIRVAGPTPQISEGLSRNPLRACRVTPFCDVLVIDNGSDPPIPGAVQVGYNSGFCHASNVGLDLARTDVVLFLNNDVVATSVDWLRPIREAVEPGVLVGARLRTSAHGDVDGQSLPYLDGWCLAGMRDDLLDLGGWDETLAEPAYYSDNLLCLNARAAGMRLREVRVGLRHLESRTSGHSLEVERVTLANRAVFAARARDLLGVAA